MRRTVGVGRGSSVDQAESGPAGFPGCSSTCGNTQQSACLPALHAAWLTLRAAAAACSWCEGSFWSNVDSSLLYMVGT